VRAATWRIRPSTFCPSSSERAACC
jgi:hypothetical protein